MLTKRTPAIARDVRVSMKQVGISPHWSAEDFCLGCFDESRLGETPPEPDGSVPDWGWRDWFPPPPRLTEVELCDLTDWVEIEAAKYDPSPDEEHYSRKVFLIERKTMETQLVPIPIPVPPAPLLEHAVGYTNDCAARYLALWWEPCGDEAMVSDGFVTFTGHWPGYLAYVQHRKVFPHLADCPLGSSEEPAQMKLVIDLRERQAMVALAREADRFLAAQWQKKGTLVQTLVLNTCDLETLVDLYFQRHPVPSMEDVKRRMEEDLLYVAKLQRWLDEVAV